MGRCREKIREEKGETLAEALVAGLIIVVAMLLLVSLILAGSHNVDRGQKKIAAYYEEMTALDGGSAGSVDEGKIKLSGVTEETYKIQIYGLTDTDTDQTKAHFWYYRMK